MGVDDSLISLQGLKKCRLQALKLCATLYANSREPSGAQPYGCAIKKC